MDKMVEMGRMQSRLRSFGHTARQSDDSEKSLSSWEGLHRKLDRVAHVQPVLHERGYPDGRGLSKMP